MAQVYLSQYSKRAGTADVALTASYAATAAQINPIRLDPVKDPNPTGLLYPTSTYLFQSASNTSLGYDMYVRQDGNLVKWKWIEGMLNTGLLYGGVLSYSASYLLITSGAGLIVNHNAVTGSEISPIVEYVTWGPITQSIENIATYQNTFVYIDVSGSASQQNVFFSPEQYQAYIPIGRVSHYNNVNANNSYENVQTVYDIDGQQNIFVRAFGPLKLKGIATSGQAGTLRLNISSGTAFNLGGYYPYNPETPSTYNMSTYNTASIIRIYRSGSGYKFDDNGGSYYTTIDPGKYDNGTGVLATVNNNDWSIQRVMVNPVTGRAHVYYGQGFYDTFDDAIGAIFSDEFVESDATAFTYPFSAYLVVKGGTNDLLNAENEIVQAGLFRNTAGGGGTGGGGIPGGQDTQIQFNNAGVFDGDPDFTYNYGSSVVTLTGSMLVSGTISASSGPTTVGFYGTASWAVSASNAISASRAFSASYALSSSRAATASFAFTSSFAVTASYASSSPNFANTNLVFTDDRNHSTNGYHYFLYNKLLGGGGTNPFDGFAVSGGFYFFDHDSNALGVGQTSTSTYKYIEVTTQSINFGFTADPAATNAYIFTNQQAYFSSSLNVTKSVYFPGLTTQPQLNVVIVDTASGQLYYTASSAIGGGGTANVAISSSGTGLTATVASINFAGAGVIATTVGDNVTVTIPGGAGVAGGANTQIQFNSGSEFSGSGNFSFDYNNNIVYLTGSSITSGSVTLTGSMFVSGAISASFGPSTVGFYGTASWAQSASQAVSSSYSNTSSFSFTSSLAYTASFVTASNVLGPFGSSSVTSASFASSSVSASYAETASLAYTASFITASNVFGPFGSSSILSASYASSSTYALTASYASNVAAAPYDTYIQYNKNGALGAEEYFRYIYTSHSLQNGYNTVALGNWSHAEGKGTIASGSYSTVVGQYNIALPSQSAFIIGDGTETLSFVGSGQLNAGTPSKGNLFSLKNSVGSGPSVGDIITVTGGSGNETFTITSVKNYGGGSYDVTVDPEAFQNFNSGNSYTISSLSISRHNLLFASCSWFDVSASSVFLRGIPTSPEVNVLIYNTSSGQVYYTASNAIGGGGSGTPANPANSIQFNNAGAFGGSSIFTFDGTNTVYLTGSSIISGSSIVTGSTSVLGTSSIDGIAFIGTSSAYALYTTAKITTVSGLNTIYSILTSSYDGAFFDYTLISGLNARAGQIMSIWSGSEIRYTETTTTDIGSTSNFIFSVSLTAGSASLQVTGSTGAIIKTIIKGI